MHVYTSFDFVYGRHAWCAAVAIRSTTSRYLRGSLRNESWRAQSESIVDNKFITRHIAVIVTKYLMLCLASSQCPNVITACNSFDTCGLLVLIAVCTIQQCHPNGAKHWVIKKRYGIDAMSVRIIYDILRSVSLQKLSSGNYMEIDTVAVSLNTGVTRELTRLEPHLRFEEQKAWD